MFIRYRRRVTTIRPLLLRGRVGAVGNVDRSGGTFHSRADIRRST